MVQNRWSNCQKSNRVDEKLLPSDYSERRKNKVLNDGIYDFILVALSFGNMPILLFNGKIIKVIFFLKIRKFYLQNLRIKIWFFEIKSWSIQISAFFHGGLIFLHQSVEA